MSTIPGFTALTPEDKSGSVGCLFILAAVLLLPGLGLVATLIISPVGKGDMFVLPLVGIVFSLVGGVLLYAGVKGARGAKFAPVELYVERDATFQTGAQVRLRLRQPGPIHVDSLSLRISCERVYQRRVKPNSSSTVEDTELLWEQELLEVRDEEVPEGGVLERDATVALPAGAQPTGPAQPDGHIRWRLQAFGDAGVLRATHREFVIDVVPGELAAGEAAAATPTPALDWSEVFPKREGEEAAPAAPAAVAPRAEAEDRHAGDAAQTDTKGRGAGKGGLSFNAGCLVISMPMLGAGVLFLWFFFSGVAAQGRGNPYMALVGGLIFSGVGLVGLVTGLSAILRGKRR